MWKCNVSTAYLKYRVHASDVKVDETREKLTSCRDNKDVGATSIHIGHLNSMSIKRPEAILILVLVSVFSKVRQSWPFEVVVSPVRREPRVHVVNIQLILVE